MTRNVARQSHDFLFFSWLVVGFCLFGRVMVGWFFVGHLYAFGLVWFGLLGFFLTTVGEELCKIPTLICLTRDKMIISYCLLDEKEQKS